MHMHIEMLFNQLGLDLNDIGIMNLNESEQDIKMKTKATNEAHNVRKHFIIDATNGSRVRLNFKLFMHRYNVNSKNL